MGIQGKRHNSLDNAGGPRARHPADSLSVGLSLALVLAVLDLGHFSFQICNQTVQLLGDEQNVSNYKGGGTTDGCNGIGRSFCGLTGVRFYISRRVLREGRRLSDWSRWTEDGQPLSVLPPSSVHEGIEG